MDPHVYYSILEWRGEFPTKRNEQYKRQFVQKILDQDISLGKVVWVNNKYKDFAYFLFYSDPILHSLSMDECDDLSISLLLLFSFTLMLSTVATYFASLKLHITNSTNVILFSCLMNASILCLILLKWKYISLSLSIYEQGRWMILVITFLLMMTIVYSFMIGMQSNDFETFLIDSLVIDGLQVIIAWIMELTILFCIFCNKWISDHRMLQPISNQTKDIILYPKCTYYITYKDYEEWVLQNEENSIEMQLNVPLLANLL